MPFFSGKKHALLLWLSTVATTTAFLPSHQSGVQHAATFSDRSESWSDLNMAFDSSEGSNIYDGPMALTKERDACGVGFVANTNEGKLFSFSNIIYCELNGSDLI